MYKNELCDRADGGAAGKWDGRWLKLREIETIMVYYAGFEFDIISLERVETHLWKQRGQGYG